MREVPLKFAASLSTFGGMTDDAPPLSEAAKRALAEAEARRKAAAEADADPRPPEEGGRAGPEPVRYGDWEVKGIATDF